MTNKIPTVGIIMSAYNAEKYIKEQVESILAQSNVNVRLWIRNDGSTDNTLKILSDEFGDDNRVVVTNGANLGAAKSFIQAIFECDFVCDYYGFSDADDVWLSNKLTISIDCIGYPPPSNPVAVATQMTVVNENLKEIGVTMAPKLGLKFSNAIVETVASGATVLMNRSAFCMLRGYRPENHVMHDAWFYVLISAFGTFLFLEQPTILYRQHGQNVFGTSHSFRKRMENRVRRLKSKSPYKVQAAEFLSAFGSQLTSENREIIERYANYDKSLVTRLLFAISPSFQTQNWMANMFLRFLVLFGKA